MHLQNDFRNVYNYDDDAVIIDSGEFDIQLSLIKTKKKEEKDFNVKFDIITGQILEISPVTIVKENPRHSIISINDTKIKRLISGKLPFSSVSVKFSEQIENYVIIDTTRNNYKPLLTQCIFDSEVAPIKIVTDYTYKKIKVNIDYIAYRNILSAMAIHEAELSSKNDMTVFFVDANDYTKLKGSVNFTLTDLLEKEKLEFSAKWLPDYSSNTIEALHSEIGINVALSESYLPIEKERVDYTRPQILYKQEENVLFLQSVMSNPDNYKVKNKINFFIFKKNDPGVLLGRISVTKEKLANFNNLNFAINSNVQVSVTTDHKHLYIEDNNASTHYKF